MKAVPDHHLSLRSGQRGYVYIARAGTFCFLSIDIVERVYLVSDDCAIPTLGEGRHPPIRNGHDKDTRCNPIGKQDGAAQKIAELLPVLIERALPVLVVNTDEQRDKIVEALGSYLVDAGI